MSMSSEFNTVFVPKENVSRTFRKQTVSVYPEIQSTVSRAENSYAFMGTKSALEATTIPFDQKLQIFAGVTRTGPLVGVLQAKFISIANAEIYKVGNFSVPWEKRRDNSCYCRKWRPSSNAKCDTCPTAPSWHHVCQIGMRPSIY
jgi:hypothetical protein